MRTDIKHEKALLLNNLNYGDSDLNDFYLTMLYILVVSNHMFRFLNKFYHSDMCKNIIIWIKVKNIKKYVKKVKNLTIEMVEKSDNNDYRKITLIN